MKIWRLCKSSLCVQYLSERSVIASCFYRRDQVSISYPKLNHSIGYSGPITSPIVSSAPPDCHIELRMWNLQMFFVATVVIIPQVHTPHVVGTQPFRCIFGTELMWNYKANIRSWCSWFTVKIILVYALGSNCRILFQNGSLSQC